MNTICKICKAHTLKWVHRNMKSDYFYCPTCHFVAKDSAIRVSSDTALMIYNKHQNATDDPEYKAYFRRFLQSAVVPYANGGKEGLDYGSGPAPVLAHLLTNEYGYAMTLYDLYYAPTPIDPNKKFDLITSTEVVEHVEDPLEYFSKLKSHLKADGILAIMTQFHDKDETGFNAWHYPRDRSHISFFTPETMAYIAQLLGLKVVYSDGKTYTTFTLNID